MLLIRTNNVEKLLIVYGFIDVSVGKIILRRKFLEVVCSQYNCLLLHCSMVFPLVLLLNGFVVVE